MTKLVNLTDAYRKKLKAEISEVGSRGSMAWVTLKETIFYAEGGGQPSDQGTIRGENGMMEVSQVTYNNGVPLHQGKIIGQLTKGETVVLEIDWERRYRNMQVHSAGHVIHEAVKELAPEVEPLEGEHGRHAYIKYKGVVDQLLKDQIQARTAEVIAQNVETTSKFVSREELETLLGSIPDYLPKNKQLRVIQVGDYPPTPDGGTQVRMTGEIPPVTIEAINYDEAGNSTITYTVAREEAMKQATVKGAVEKIPEFEELLAKVRQEIEQEGDRREIRATVLGKKGWLNTVFGETLAGGRYDKTVLGRSFNQLKSELEKELETAETIAAPGEKLSEKDLTLPGTPVVFGLLHPVNVVAREINEIFHGLGFSVADGPEIETDEFNYNRLNLPADHPARDLQDSLYIKEPEILLRTHTSSVEAHILAERKPPYRFVFPGKCYRFENVNASNHMMFYQYQGLAIGRQITMANLKATFDIFLRKFYGEETKSRFRCKYYPEVEPGVGVDIDCPFCHQKGCSVCKFRGWIEISGAGMVHPNMLRKVGLDPQEYSGFAFGMGLDRVAMTRYGIDDIRALFNGDLVYET